MDVTLPRSGARWVGGAKSCQSPVILRRFSCRRAVKATLQITGLGYFHTCINGRPVTDHRLQPVCSEYAPRALQNFLYPLRDRVDCRIYYCTYDVTGLLEAGENLLTVQLGNGWYRQTERVAEGQVSYGDRLKVIYCLTLEYPDSTEAILSDGSETWRSSHILYNNLFIGEVHDYLHKPDAERPVSLLPHEPGQLTPQIGAPDKVMRCVTPRLISHQKGVKLYDAGEVLSGVVRLLTAPQPGETVTIRFAEELTADGCPDFESTGSGYTCASGRPQIQTDVCICGNVPRYFQPLFCWHAFRYFTVEGPGTEPQVLVIHSDCKVKSAFQSDCEGMNFLYNAFLRTQLANMHGSIPSDCPHRERLGYTGDGQVAAAAAMMTLSCREFYEKWMQDILDTQDKTTGHVQHTAPLGGGGGGPVGWGGAIVVVPYRYFKEYGDISLMERAWRPIQKWLGYLKTRMERGLIAAEEEKGWCLGDWATPEETMIPAPFVNTCLLIRYLDMLLETAPLAKQQQDMEDLRQLQSQCREAVVKEYYDAANGTFCGSIQGADAYGLYTGLGDARTVRQLIHKYDNLGCLDTGFIGTDVLMEVLLERHAADTAHSLLTSQKCGSFLYMKHRGATTLWENWNGKESHCHPMMGGCVRQLFEGFLGIRQTYGTGGYSHVTVEPQLPEKVSFLEGRLETPAGEIRVALKRVNGAVEKEIVLP